MNKDLSDINKLFQQSIVKKATFKDGISYLLELRKRLIETISLIETKCKSEDYTKMPLKSDKTIAFYLYHMARIEDITANTLIRKSEEIFFKNKYDETLNIPLITTGNELSKKQIIDFSNSININNLFNYFLDVHYATNELILNIGFEELKNKFTLKDKETLRALKVVSEDESAIWLIDYWCDKDYLGIMKMPFSRHLIMHFEGCYRIMKKLSLI